MTKILKKVVSKKKPEWGSVNSTFSEMFTRTAAPVAMKSDFDEDFSELEGIETDISKEKKDILAKCATISKLAYEVQKQVSQLKAKIKQEY